MTDFIQDTSLGSAAAGGRRDSAQRRQSDRRHLWDRRARDERRGSDDRRRRDRRHQSRLPMQERRAGHDRRAGDRRLASDRRAVAFRRRGRRRRDTPTPYNGEQVVELRARFAAAGRVSCPACGGTFTLGVGQRRGTQFARRVACLGCGRAAVVPHAVAARVLIIDRQGERREALRAVLTAAGHEVIETDEAGVALQAYAVSPADVILLNVLATGRMEAPAFLRRLRREFPDARVVAVAGRSSRADADPLAVAQGLGASHALRIPASAEAVLRCVDEARR